MTEVQSHGFVFEKWVRDQFFGGYKNKYSAKWDIPAEKNKKLGRIPVSIKTAKYHSTINLGDALRQFQTNEDFLLIVGFWKQNGIYKKIVNASAVLVKKGIWKALWEPLTEKQLKSLDNLIKDKSVGYVKIRAKAQKLKRSFPVIAMTLNPKIDSKTQRRLQCGLRFNLYFDKLAPKHSREAIKSPILFGKKVPPPWKSGSRVFNRIKA